MYLCMGDVLHDSDVRMSCGNGTNPVHITWVPCVRAWCMGVHAAHIHTYTYTQTHTQTQTHTDTYTYTHTHTHTLTDLVYNHYAAGAWIHACTHICTAQTHTHTHTHRRIHRHRHRHRHRHTHTHTHAHAHAQI